MTPPTAPKKECVYVRPEHHSEVEREHDRNLHARIAELERGLTRTQLELNEILHERNDIAKENDEARAALRKLFELEVGDVDHTNVSLIWSENWSATLEEARRVLGEKITKEAAKG